MHQRHSCHCTDIKPISKRTPRFADLGPSKEPRRDIFLRHLGQSFRRPDVTALEGREEVLRRICGADTASTESSLYLMPDLSLSLSLSLSLLSFRIRVPGAFSPQDASRPTHVGAFHPRASRPRDSRARATTLTVITFPRNQRIRAETTGQGHSLTLARPGIHSLFAGAPVGVKGDNALRRRRKSGERARRSAKKQYHAPANQVGSSCGGRGPQRAAP